MALAFTGRYDESIAESKRAAELDPLSPQVLVDATMAPMFEKNFDAAKVLARKAGELDPTYFFPVMIEGWVAIEAGKFRDAVPLIRKSTTMGAPPFVTAYLAYTLAAAGDRVGAMASLDTLKKMSEGGRVQGPDQEVEFRRVNRCGMSRLRRHGRSFSPMAQRP